VLFSSGLLSLPVLPCSAITGGFALADFPEPADVPDFACCMTGMACQRDCNSGHSSLQATAARTALR
jgi:hypothetical protein